MMKIPIYINANIPALMQPTLTHYEPCFLCVAHTCLYDRQSSRMSFTATVTSYIQVTQSSNLHMKTTSPCGGHTSCPSFLRLFILLLGYFVIYLGYPKSYIGYV